MKFRAAVKLIDLGDGLVSLSFPINGRLENKLELILIFSGFLSSISFWRDVCSRGLKLMR